MSVLHAVGDLVRMGFSSVLLHGVGCLVRLGLRSVRFAGCWRFGTAWFE